MRIDQSLLEHLQTWVGRQETLTDQITSAPIRGLSATLDRDDGEPVYGQTRLPELWHWIYFLSAHRQSQIGPDGHAKRGGFLPPVPLPRRMWAGGRVKWLESIRAGDRVKRVSTIKSVTHKVGRTGDLIFVLVEHQIHNPESLVLVEEQDIVYRDNPSPDEKPVAPTEAPADAVWTKSLRPDEVLLFRYSALTFNGHRIHYDRRYVTEVEKYPGLVVHGPLIATLLIDLVRERVPSAELVEYQFKAIRPVFDLAPMTVNGRPAQDGKTVELWASDGDGYLAMKATAKMR